MQENGIPCKPSGDHLDLSDPKLCSVQPVTSSGNTNTSHKIIPKSSSSNNPAPLAVNMEPLQVEISAPKGTGAKWEKYEVARSGQNVDPGSMDQTIGADRSLLIGVDQTEVSS